VALVDEAVERDLGDLAALVVEVLGHVEVRAEVVGEVEDAEVCDVTAAMDENCSQA
jgi:hypothetical protein